MNVPLGAAFAPPGIAAAPSLRRLLALVLAWRQARAGLAELAALPDHSLRDIGLRRDQIQAAALGGLRRDYSFFSR